MKLRCYCCGEALGARFALVSMSDSADRVFVMLPEHIKRLRDATSVMMVRREKR